MDGEVSRQGVPSCAHCEWLRLPGWLCGCSMHVAWDGQCSFQLAVTEAFYSSWEVDCSSWLYRQDILVAVLLAVVTNPPSP